MGMTVHELTTNAAKYGALKTEKGQIEVSWRVDRRKGSDHLTFHWRELGVNVENISPARGFGAEVIERSLAYMRAEARGLPLPHRVQIIDLSFPCL